MRIASRLAITVGLALAAIGVGAASASAATYSNPAPIAIPSSGLAVPYPSQIAVSGQTGPISDLNVKLNALSHTSPPDIGVALIGPGGQALVLMSCVSNSVDATNVNLRLDDSSPIQLPPNSSALASASYKPAYHAGCPAPRSFPLPGPGTAYGNPGPLFGGTATLASTFNGASANGIWSLFAGDYAAGNGGQFAGGWSLEISPDPPLAAKEEEVQEGLQAEEDQEEGQEAQEEVRQEEEEEEEEEVSAASRASLCGAGRRGRRARGGPATFEHSYIENASWTSMRAPSSPAIGLPLASFTAAS